MEEKWRDLYPYQVVLMCHQVVSGGAIRWCQVVSSGDIEVSSGGVRWWCQMLSSGVVEVSL